MSTLSDLVAERSELSLEDTEWLQLLVGDWQVISDLSFADLVLWIPTPDGSFVAVAQARPSTGATVHLDDVVGSAAPEPQREQLMRALTEGTIQRSREPRWFGSFAVREEAIPVVRDGRAIAVVARETNLGGARTPSRLEINYVEAADDLIAMIARGEFPSLDAGTGPRRGAPRVGDGLLRLDAEGRVLYASPNALSCFHRLGVLGTLVGRSLAEVAAEVVDEGSMADESVPLVVTGRARWRTELLAGSVCVSVRALPLTENGRRTGAVLLCRDVSELRRRERELITKDATIREINHRVKNNLQTVAALLRLQARRMSSPEARAALEEAMRRVATIAMVHETLSGTLDEMVAFDELVDRSLRLTVDVASHGSGVQMVRTGRVGMVPAADATPLALVLTELVTNAVEHGLAGRSGVVEVIARRDGADLELVVSDDGTGWPVGEEPPAGLGMQIVRTLVSNELQGTIRWERGRADGAAAGAAADGGSPAPQDGEVVTGDRDGTRVTIHVTLRGPKARDGGV